MTQPKVYVVTDGEYSDYHTIGVFTSKQKAVKFQNLFRGKYLSVNELIEEYSLNPFEKEISQELKRYSVSMKKNGDVSYVEIKLSCFDDLKDGLEYRIWRADHPTSELNVFCWAKDTKHAIKIANEKRTQLIASNQWRAK